MAGAAPAFAPRDPETFFHAQKRNRRATWRMSALCGVSAVLMGVPLTLVLTPLMYAVTLVGADIINAISPLPPEFWSTVNDLSRLAVRVADYLLNQRGTVSLDELAFGLSLALLPGMLLALLLWLGVLMLFRHGGVGGTLASLKAREPNPQDLKELQLSDVVQEMAIAAGLPAPKLMLIDSPGANAAAIGNSPADARIVLSRRLIDDLDRDQLQALLAHLVASIGNGDLHIAFMVTSVFETCGLIITLINAPFGKQSRSTLWRILRYPFRRGAPDAQRMEAAEVAELLADMLDVNSTDIERFFERRNPGVIRKFFRLLFFPFQFTNIAVETTLWFFLNVLLGPSMALLWRTRRYLADAGSIELTRNPDALARALQRLGEDDASIAGGSWASHLFVLNPKGDRTLRDAVPSGEQARKAIEAWNASAQAANATGGTGPADPRAAVAATPQDFLEFKNEMRTAVMAAMRGDAASIARLQAMAAAMGEANALDHLPNANDIVLAQRGDRAAIARIRVQMQARSRTEQSSSRASGLQEHSFVSFHPSLSRRAKRLVRMGAHISAGRKRGIGLTIVYALLTLVAIPAFTFLGAMMLFVVALMICLNLMFLTLWLMVIHWAFGQDWSANYRGFLRFVDDVSRALNKARR